MRLKRQPCECKCDNYKISYKGLHMFFMSSVECKKCHKKHKIRGVFENMSIQYIDIMFKIILILVMIYYAILKWVPGILYMVAMFFFLNYVIYPLLFKLGFMMIDNRKEDKKCKKH